MHGNDIESTGTCPPSMLRQETPRRGHDAPPLARRNRFGGIPERDRTTRLHFDEDHDTVVFDDQVNLPTPSSVPACQNRATVFPQMVRSVVLGRPPEGVTSAWIGGEGGAR